MKGIQFMINDRGEKTSVLIDLKEHAELWEDFYDALLARSSSRAEEPLKSVRGRLKKYANPDLINKEKSAWAAGGKGKNIMICDANIILRYLLEDIPELSEKAAQFIENKEIFIPFEVAAEVVYVLEKVYNISRKELSQAVIDMIHYSNITTVDKKVLEYALNLFSESKTDFVDTLLCGYAYVQHADIITFDHKLSNRIKRIKKP